MSFKEDISAGVFSALSESDTVASCVRKACNRRAGNIAFLVERNCYMVTCYSKTSCETEMDPSIFKVSITRYTWFGKLVVRGQSCSQSFPLNRLLSRRQLRLPCMLSYSFNAPKKFQFPRALEDVI